MIAKEHIQSLFDAAGIRLVAANLDEQLPLTQQGVDSLDMAGLLFQIEQTCSSTISPDEFEQLRTLSDIAKYIDDAQAAAASGA